MNGVTTEKPGHQETFEDIPLNQCMSLSQNLRKKIPKPQYNLASLPPLEFSNKFVMFLW